LNRLTLVTSATTIRLRIGDDTFTAARDSNRNSCPVAVQIATFRNVEVARAPVSFWPVVDNGDGIVYGSFHRRDAQRRRRLKPSSARVGTVSSSPRDQA